MGWKQRRIILSSNAETSMEILRNQTVLDRPSSGIMAVVAQKTATKLGSGFFLENVDTA